MAWPGYDMYNAPRVVVADRPGRGRPRLGSDYPRQTTYFTDPNGNLLPQAVHGVGRSNSVSGGPPAQIFINNSQRDEFSPPHSAHARRKSRARSPSYSSDESWDERAHSPRRHHRGHVPSRARDRSRSHSRRRHSHSRHHEHVSRSPSPAHWDYETERKMKKLEELERKEKEEAARERAKQEMLIEDAKKAAKKKEEEEFKKRVIAEAEREKYEKEMKEKKRKEEEDKVFMARLKDMYLAQGYSEESIETMIKDAQEKKKHDHGHGHGHGSPGPHGPPSIGGHGNEIVMIEKGTKVVDLNRPTFIKVHRKYLSPDTLDAFDLPWEWDDRDSNFIIIKGWINENDQDRLFEHSRKLREQRLITNEKIELKKENGKLKLVREKSPNRQRSRSHSRSWIFT
ncbi:MAG: hypothetical protein Q9184_000770 [Pyrenodesmia sp. 2 TL-2023]